MSLDNERAVHLSMSFPHKHIFTHLMHHHRDGNSENVRKDYRHGALRVDQNALMLSEACQRVIQENFRLKKNKIKLRSSILRYGTCVAAGGVSLKVQKRT